jgi:hypothetical protein
MCFSATASLTAGAGLLIIGAIAISQSKTTPQRVLASIPVVFSIQQFSEGLLWLSLSGVITTQWQNISMYVFLVFAQVVWPSFVPLTILLFEKNVRRKQILRMLLIVGILTSLYLSWCLLFYNVSAMIEGHHIKYELDFPLGIQWFSGLTYILAAVMAPFISSLRPFRLLGILLLASYLVSRIFYQDYLISVWCYFAAILSISILIIIRGLRKVEISA